MKKIILISFVFLALIACKSNNVSTSIENSSLLDCNYILANMYVEDINREEINDYIITIYKYSSKEKIPSEGTHEIMLII